MQDILAESDARMLTELLGDVRDGILITDEAGRIKYVNDTAIHPAWVAGSGTKRRVLPCVPDP